MLQVGPDRVQISDIPKQNRRVWISNGKKKVILGYESICYASQDPVEQPLDLCLNPSYHSIPNLFLESLEGIPMEFEQLKSGMRIRYTLVKWMEEPLDETYFALPESYEKVSKKLYQSWLR